eukprot:CAMPEP_0176119524 /NCGR_PEP_ID=MMETSP0120_2-20121206/60097_1 /TAXON_ID=160619 /ORGANISM="Kryptoperidinium foliaceum, Strain CCMP 1326" /LENGTH=157 /DNA_ID=CAMNT_0017453927 /DNA_START=23 /DNA_END=493 /DNA_ORIENTATION=-
MQKRHCLTAPHLAPMAAAARPFRSSAWLPSTKSDLFNNTTMGTPSGSPQSVTAVLNSVATRSESTSLLPSMTKTKASADGKCRDHNPCWEPTPMMCKFNFSNVRGIFRHSMEAAASSGVAGHCPVTMRPAIALAPAPGMPMTTVRKSFGPPSLLGPP